MAFETYPKTERRFQKMRGKGRLHEADIRGHARVRMALLKPMSVIRSSRTLSAPLARAVGRDVLESLTPAQMVIKIVNEELCALMGGTNSKIKIASKPPTVVMLVGLQGSGKTTNGAKLAALMRKQQGKRPLLVACDIYRPAAIKQLETVGAQLISLFFRWGRRILLTLPKLPSSMPAGTETISFSSTQPAVSTSTKR